MSGKIMGQVFGLKLKKTQRATLLAIANYTNDEGRGCYASLARLAWMISEDDEKPVSVRTVQRAIKPMVESGLIIAHPRPGMTTVYDIDIGAGTPKTGFVRGDTAMSGVPATSNVRGDIPAKVSGVTKLCQGGGDKAVSGYPLDNQKNLDSDLNIQSNLNQVWGNIEYIESVSLDRMILAERGLYDSAVRRGYLEAGGSVEALVEFVQAYDLDTMREAVKTLVSRCKQVGALDSVDRWMATVLASR